jgi:hypothetical protein
MLDAVRCPLHVTPTLSMTHLYTGRRRASSDTAAHGRTRLKKMTKMPSPRGFQDALGVSIVRHLASSAVFSPLNRPEPKNNAVFLSR